MIIPVARYPNQTNTTSSGYPYGSAKNAVTPGDGTGTPLEQSWVNDVFGFFQSLLKEANIGANNLPERVGLSQGLQSIKSIIDTKIDAAKEKFSKVTSGGLPDAPSFRNVVSAEEFFDFSVTSDKILDFKNSPYSRHVIHFTSLGAGAKVTLQNNGTVFYEWGQHLAGGVHSLSFLVTKFNAGGGNFDWNVRILDNTLGRRTHVWSSGDSLYPSIYSTVLFQDAIGQPGAGAETIDIYLATAEVNTPIEGLEMRLVFETVFGSNSSPVTLRFRKSNLEPINLWKTFDGVYKNTVEIGGNPPFDAAFGPTPTGTWGNGRRKTGLIRVVDGSWRFLGFMDS